MHWHAPGMPYSFDTICLGLVHTLAPSALQLISRHHFATCQIINPPSFLFLSVSSHKLFWKAKTWSIYFQSWYMWTLSAWSHYFNLSPAKNFKRFSRFWFSTSVFPSFWGWYVELYCNFVAFFFHNVCKKLLKYLVSLLIVIAFWQPLQSHNLLEEKFCTIPALLFLQGMKCAILGNLSTTINFASNHCCVLDSPSKRSIDISFYGILYWQ